MADFASPDFQRAFAAMSYMLGRRGEELLAPLLTASDDAEGFVRRLGHPDRRRRAEVLARELSRLVIALDARSFK